MPKAEQIALLKVEEGTVIDKRMQQAALDDEQLLLRQLATQIIRSLDFDGGTRRGETFEKLGGDSLQAVDEAVGVGRLFPE
ncbi:hypothetical protein STUTZSP0542_15500 [Stutzerimonas marianensis]